MALKFAKNHKCKIIIYDVNEECALKVVKEIEELGGQSVFFKCDLGNENEIQACFEKTIKQFKFVDILINNAAIVNLKMFNESNFEKIKQVMDVNYIAPVSLIKKFYPLMMEQDKGHIINISSAASIVPSLKMSEYCASKAALSGYHNALRLEILHQKKNIKTTLVCPNAINTGMFKGFSNKFDFLLPMLKEEYVGQQIYEGIISNRKEIYLPWWIKQLSFFLRLLPVSITDFVGIMLLSDNTKKLVGRENQDQQSKKNV